MLNYKKILKMSDYELSYNSDAIIEFEEYNKLKDFLFEKNFKLYLDYVIEETKKLKVHWDKIENYDIDKYIEEYEENLADKIVNYIDSEEIKINKEYFDAEDFIAENQLEDFEECTVESLCYFSKNELYEILKNNYINEVEEEELQYKIANTIRDDSSYSRITDLVLTKLEK